MIMFTNSYAQIQSTVKVVRIEFVFFFSFGKQQPEIYEKPSRFILQGPISLAGSELCSHPIESSTDAAMRVDTVVQFFPMQFKHIEAENGCMHFDMYVGPEIEFVSEK